MTTDLTGRVACSRWARHSGLCGAAAERHDTMIDNEIRDLIKRTDLEEQSKKLAMQGLACFHAGLAAYGLWRLVDAAGLLWEATGKAPMPGSPAQPTKRGFQLAKARNWSCPGCQRTVSHPYEALAEVGVPVCGDCDIDMELDPE